MNFINFAHILYTDINFNLSTNVVLQIWILYYNSKSTFCVETEIALKSMWNSTIRFIDIKQKEEENVILKTVLSWLILIL